MEGVPPAPRKPRSDAGRARKAKAEKATKKEKEAKRKKEKEAVKAESTETAQGAGGFEQGGRGRIKPEPYIKPEPFVKPEPRVKDEPTDDVMDYERSEEPVTGRSADVERSGGDAVAMQTQAEGEGEGDTGYVSPYPQVQDYRAGSAASGEVRVNVKAEPIDI